MYIGWKKCCPNPLLIIFVVSFSSLCFGTLMAMYDINRFGAGLYLSLVSVVTVVVVFAFCLVGTEEQTEPTVAKKVWSTTRQTIRRYARSKAEVSRAAPVDIRIVQIDLSEELEKSDCEEYTPETAGQSSDVEEQV